MFTIMFINGIIFLIQYLFYIKEWVLRPLFNIAYIMAISLWRRKRMEVQKMARNIETVVEELVSNILLGTELELVDVEYVKERDWYLRVFIDKDGGIGIEDCEQLSEKLEAALDEKDIVQSSYILEVSSPGLDRVLKKERDFQREQGKAIDVTLYAPLDGQKELTGTLIAADEQNLTIETVQGTQALQREKIAQVRLHIDF